MVLQTRAVSSESVLSIRVFSVVDDSTKAENIMHL